MTSDESIVKVFAAELPEAVVTVENGGHIEADFAEVLDLDVRKASYEIFVDIVNQLADGLYVEFESYNVIDYADVDRTVFSANILPVLA